MPHPNAARLRGLLTAILTPFDMDGKLALEVMPALLDFQRKARVDGVVVCGTNGEGTSLSVEERKRTLETVLEHKEGLTVIAGTGAASVTDAVELTRHAAQAGADAALVLPPFFYKNPTAEGLANYFRPVLDAADLPILLYSIPQFSAVPITNEVLDLLADHPNLSGVKDSAGDWTRTNEILTRYPHLTIFPGSDRLAAKAHAHGAGGISGGANAFPEYLAAVRDCYHQRKHPGLSDGDWIKRSAEWAGVPLKELAEKVGVSSGELAGYVTGGEAVPADALARIAAVVEAPAAQKAQDRLNALIDITMRYPLIAVSKSVLAHRGLPRMGVRPPLVNLAPAQETELLQALWADYFLTAD